MCNVRNIKMITICESLQNILMSVYPTLNSINYYVTNCYALLHKLLTLFSEETHLFLTHLRVSGHTPVLEYSLANAKKSTI